MLNILNKAKVMIGTVEEEELSELEYIPFIALVFDKKTDFQEAYTETKNNLTLRETAGFGYLKAFKIKSSENNLIKTIIEEKDRSVDINITFKDKTNGGILLGGTIKNKGDGFQNFLVHYRDKRYFRLVLKCEETNEMVHINQIGRKNEQIEIVQK